MRAVCRNIFREYNIPRDKPKRHRRASKPRSPIKNKSLVRTTNATTSLDERIENFSEDENLSPKSYSFVQLRRSFEIPLNIVHVRKGCPDAVQNPAIKKKQEFEKAPKWIRGGMVMPTPPDEDSDDDLMPRPIVIKQEPLTQPSEEIRLTMLTPSVSSSIDSITPRLRSKLSSDESSISSGEEDLPENTNRSRKTSLTLSETASVKRSRKEIMARYRPLDISITKANTDTTTSRRKITPRKKKTNSAVAKRKTRSQTSQAKNRSLDESWSVSEEEPEPFQSNLADRSFICSSPKPSQIINTPSSTPSPRKRPSELDLMIELIEKENSLRNASVRKSPRKSTKRCLPGGLVEQYQRSLGKAKTDARFLKHDKKFGLRDGLVLQILELESSHGVHLATVQSENEEKFVIALSAEMLSQIKVGSKIEAFFDESTKPYGLKSKDGTCLNVFIKPYKLLLL